MIRSPKTAHFLLWILVFLNGGCTSFFGSSSYNYDSHKFKIQFVSLFNQRESPKTSTVSWKGDWIFRRERLSLVDKALGDLKPDLIIFQEALSHDFNSFESDQGILSAGVLKGYKWRNARVKEHEDTGEFEFHSLAFSPPIGVVNQDDNVFVIASSYLSIEILKLENWSFMIANMKLDLSTTDSHINEFIKEIKKKQDSEKVCDKRLIVAVSAPPEIQDKLIRLTQMLGVQDATKDFCELESKCFTASPTNEIFALTKGAFQPSRMDFLFVPPDNKVFAGEVSFTEGIALKSGYYRRFGLKNLWPTQRFGIRVDMNLVKCY